MCFSADPPPYVSRAHGKKARHAERDRITRYSQEQIPRVQQASSALHAALEITPGEQEHAVDPALPRRIPYADEVLNESARRVIVMGPPPLPAPGMRSGGRRNAGDGTAIPSTGSLEKDMQLRGFYSVNHDADDLYQSTLQEDVSYRDYWQRSERPVLLPKGTLTTVYSDPGDDTLGEADSSPSFPVAARQKAHKRGLSEGLFKPRKVAKIDGQNSSSVKSGLIQSQPGME